MAVFKLETKNKVDIDKKPRVYFTCHPEDFKKHFKKVCDDIFKTHDCAIYYTEDMTEVIAEDEKAVDLGRNNLFVVPVTFKLLTTLNRAMDADIPYALEKHIPILPILMELVDDELYSSKFGELQYLNPLSEDRTEIPYEEKLKKHLESVLISKELADRIRHAFYAYIFLSYRKVDRVYANTLMRLIHSIPECRDFAIWFDEFLTPGESFKSNIEKALDNCKLFTFLVTERLFKKNINKNGEEENNFVMEEELPKAKGKRAEKGTKIIAVEMENAGKDAPLILEADDYIRYDDLEFRDRILAAVSKIKYDAVNTPEHAFLMGLAYLEGIDMEVDRERAVELITSAAEADLPEAIAKLISMYIDGIGVSRNQKEAQKWSERLAEYYFERIFSKKGAIKSKKKIYELFSNYMNKYYAETIKSFLVYADKRLPFDAIKTLYELLMSIGICEYTLLLDACKHMSQHQEKTQIILVTDILTKSVNGTYPPYGPLFWYIPEYELYEVSLLTLDSLKNSTDFVKMLALVRDVCWIFGQKNTINEMTVRVDGASLYDHAKGKLNGVRKALCELFYIETTDFNGGNDIYPRCFNVAEAKTFIDYDCGVFSILDTPFVDELNLYSHNTYTEVREEYIGIVSCPYNVIQIEKSLAKKSTSKLRGLILSPTEHKTMVNLSFNKSNLSVIYIPENIIEFENNWNEGTKLSLSIAKSEAYKLYLRECATLPDHINEIPDAMFSSCSGLKHLAISSSVTTIGKYAFCECSSLLDFTIPDSVTEIGEGAFSGCVSLESIVLPKKIRQISDFTFLRCFSLDSIAIPLGTTKIGVAAFHFCTSMKYIDLPNTLIEIDASAFSKCSNLSFINIPNGLKRIGESAFKNCKRITSVSIPDSVTLIEEGAFNNCIHLELVKLSQSIKNIKAFTFEDCCNIREICIPDSVDKIEEFSFRGFGKLEIIQFSKNAKTLICSRAFMNCTGLSVVSLPIDVNVAPNGFDEHIVVVRNTPKHLLNIEIPMGTETVKKLEYAHRKDIYTVHIPEGVKKIEFGAFSFCSSLTSITLPSTINIIEEGAFTACECLESINIPYGVTAIENDTFSGCTNLSMVQLPNSIEKIGEYAFSACKSLTSIILPNNITCIEEGAFSGCIGLQTVNIPEPITSINNNTFLDCSALSTIKLPHGTKFICANAFSGCSNLVSIDLPMHLERIEEGAFKRCKNLKAMNIPNGIETIEEYTFSECDRLENVNLPGSLFTIGGNAFEKCISLKNILLPSGLLKIAGLAFSGCVCLEKITIPSKVTELGVGTFYNCKGLKTISIPSGIKKINWNLFDGCESLISIDLPGSITIILSEAFSGCKSLKSINIPPAVTEIGFHAFKCCHSLNELDIPQSVKKIGNMAFEQCYSLTSVIISRRFESSISQFFGDIDPNIITFI